jgi:SulP family sulfate permease
MAFWAAMPTQCALVFFGILHVPLNVPALGVSLAEDNVKLDRELVAHGFSNLASGLTGTVPNYLTYVNTVLCESSEEHCAGTCADVVVYRCGGGSRLSGVMLALATGAIMFVGPTIIGFLRQSATALKWYMRLTRIAVTLVGALIFVLGLDLAIEAVWDTRNRVNKMEYVTIWAIAIGMTV